MAIGDGTIQVMDRLRCSERVAAALRSCASEDARSISSLVRALVVQGLRARGYLATEREFGSS